MKVFGNKLKQKIFRRGMDSLQKSLHDAQTIDNRIKIPKNFVNFLTKVMENETSLKITWLSRGQNKKIWYRSRKLTFPTSIRPSDYITERDVTKV